MTPTQTDQRPQECKLYRKRNFLEWLMDDFPHCDCPDKESGICIYGKEKPHCPDFTPKTDK